MSKSAEQDFFDSSYESGNRIKSVGQVYSIARQRVREYEDLIYSQVAGMDVLEYGCGTGSHSLEIARRGGKVVGIDISEIGIEKARAKAAAEGVANASYVMMDAENMTFPDDSFDLVIGEGILHHLDLPRSYSEIARVLRPGGRAIFMEPLGHNPAMVLFRMRTPHLRTADEHPLVKKDLDLAARYFGTTRFRYYHLTSFASLALLRTKLFWPAVGMLDRVDRGLFRAIPALGLLSWYTVMIMTDPIPAKAGAEK